MELLFYISFLIIFYAYFGYPISLYFLNYIKCNPINKHYFSPQVSIIIAAHNEEKNVYDKIINCLNVDYPADKLQIIVVSDGSTDKTNEIVQSFLDRGVQLIVSPERRGKEFAQKIALHESRGEIVVFSDVATRIEPRGIHEIVANFADPSVGCVSSYDRLLSQDGSPCGEGAYVRYEMWIRKLESNINTLVGLSGSFFASRKEYCPDLTSDIDSDFVTVLNTVRHGKRAILDSEAVGLYKDLSDSKKEFQRKVRTVLRGMTCFFKNLEMLNAFKFGFFSYQLFCHKLLRWLVPFFLISFFVSNIFLITDSSFYLFFIISQVIFYVLCFLCHIKIISLRYVWSKIPYYFVMSNIAITHAWFDFLRGVRLHTWQPTSR